MAQLQSNAGMAAPRPRIALLHHTFPSLCDRGDPHAFCEPVSRLRRAEHFASARV
jgi:hypothetical protein